jgi:uncharacterized membrane protein
MATDKKPPAKPDPWVTGFGFLVGPIALYFLLIHAFPRLVMTPETYGDYYWDRRYWLMAHTVFGIIATLIGPLQFFTKFRAKNPGLHRLNGMVYLAAVAIAALSALVLASTSRVSEGYQLGLALAAGVWLSTAAMAVMAIRARQIAQHRAWMVRNYTVTFFFIVFFALFDLAKLIGVHPQSDPAVYVFIALLGPLAVVEAILRARGMAGKALERA